MQIPKPNQDAKNLGVCLQCQQLFPLYILNFKAQFNSYICKECYKIQSEQLMVYKKNKPTLYPSIDQILPHIYLGNEDAATDPQTFDSRDISAVCVCGDYLLSPFESKFQYKKYDISDCPEQKILHYFEENYQWVTKMTQQNKKILFHCAAGVSRSASFVIAYLMKHQGISYEEAHSFVKTKRPIIKPNSGFVKQLLEYEKFLFQNQVKNQQSNMQKQ